MNCCMNTNIPMFSISSKTRDIRVSTSSRVRINKVSISSLNNQSPCLLVSLSLCMKEPQTLYSSERPSVVTPMASLFITPICLVMLPSSWQSHCCGYFTGIVGDVRGHLGASNIAWRLCACSIICWIPFMEIQKILTLSQDWQKEPTDLQKQNCRLYTWVPSYIQTTK